MKRHTFDTFQLCTIKKGTVPLGYDSFYIERTYLIEPILREIHGLNINIIKNRTMAAPPKKPKYCTSDTLSNTFANCAFSACAAVLVKNHNAIVCAAKASGANLVVADKPTGDINNSPNTTNKNDATNQNGLTNVLPSDRTAGIIIIKNDAPAKNNENENLIGVDG